MNAVTNLVRELSCGAVSGKGGTPYQIAREIMGQNFFGFEEGVHHYGADPRLSHFKQLAYVPFSIAELEAVAKTSAFVMTFEVSVDEMMSRVPGCVSKPVYFPSSYAKSKFGCMLVHLTLRKVDFTESDVERQHHGIHSWDIFGVLLGHFLVTGEWLLGQGEGLVCNEHPGSASARFHVVHRDREGKLTVSESGAGCSSVRNMWMSFTLPKTNET